MLLINQGRGAGGGGGGVGVGRVGGGRYQYLLLLFFLKLHHLEYKIAEDNLEIIVTERIHWIIQNTLLG